MCNYNSVYTRRRAQELCVRIAPAMTDRSLSVQTKLLATLWTLSTPESFRSIGDRFDMGKSTLHKVFKETCSALCGLCHELIKMPATATEMSTVSDGFLNKTGFPGVIGAVDGTHIPIPGPSDHRSSYINRKGQSRNA